MKNNSKKFIIATIILVTVAAIVACFFINSSNDTLKLTLNQNDCETISPVFALSGKVTDSEDPTEILYSVTAELDNYESANGGYLVFDGKEWSTEVTLRPGKNRIVITALQNGEKVTKEISVGYDIGKPYELNNANINFDEKSEQKYVNNIIPVVFSADATQEEIQSVADLCDGEIVGRVDFFYHIRVKENSYSKLQEICNEINKKDCVESAFVDTVIDTDQRSVIPDDPWGNSAYWSEDTPEGNNWGIKAINVPEAWSYADNFSSLAVAVADTGFDTEHEDLAGVLTPSFEHSNNLGYQDSVTNKYVISDHGTHVSGTIGAKANNGKGLTGIIPNAKIYYTDIFQNSGTCKTSDILNSLIYSVQAGAKVVNYSIGSYVYISNKEYLEGGLNKYTQRASSYSFHAINAANVVNTLLLQGYDFLVVQSAGNGALVEVSPGKYETFSIDASHNGQWATISEETLAHTNLSDSQKQAILDRIIVVGAASLTEDGTYQQAPFSNTGTNVDICAPGYNIYSTAVGNKYITMNGTSMAAPHVTGVCGLTWSANPNLTGSEVKKIVCSSTKDTVYDNPSPNHTGTDVYKMVNAKLSVEAALQKISAQKGNYSSIVRDSQTNLPIANVSVNLYDYNTNEFLSTVTTDSNGYFSLNLSTGTYLIKFNHNSYKSASTIAISSGSFVNKKDAVFMEFDTEPSQTTSEETTEPSTTDTSSDYAEYEMRTLQYSRKAPDGTVYEKVTVNYPFIKGDSSIAQTFQLLYEKKYALEKSNAEHNDTDYSGIETARNYAEKNNTSFPVETYRNIAVVYNRNGFISVKETETTGYNSPDEATPFYSTYVISTGETVVLTDIIKGSEDEINNLLSQYDNSISDFFADNVFTEIGLTEDGVCVQIFTTGLGVSCRFITVPYISNSSPLIFA